MEARGLFSTNWTMLSGSGSLLYVLQTQKLSIWLSSNLFCCWEKNISVEETAFWIGCKNIKAQSLCLCRFFVMLQAASGLSQLYLSFSRTVATLLWFLDAESMEKEAVSMQLLYVKPFGLKLIRIQSTLRWDIDHFVAYCTETKLSLLSFPSLTSEPRFIVFFVALLSCREVDLNKLPGGDSIASFSKFTLCLPACLIYNWHVYSPCFHSICVYIFFFFIVLPTCLMLSVWSAGGCDVLVQLLVVMAL